MQSERGTLYIVATPIGNLQDISLRALQVLAEVDVVYAEDTRHSRKFFQSHGLSPNLVSLHEHNEIARVPSVVALLESGQNAALISDAGTPLISDPGYRVVAECHEKGIKVSPIPGASALITALSVSGLPTDSFLYLGFPPVKSVARRQWFSHQAQQTCTMVFYESRHRIVACIKDMADEFGVDRLVTVAREITKQYETIKRATLADLLLWVESDVMQQKGEFVVIVSGAEKVDSDTGQSEVLLRMLLSDVSVKRSVEIVQSTFGGKKNHLYKLALEITKQ